MRNPNYIVLLCIVFLVLIAGNADTEPNFISVGCLSVLSPGTHRDYELHLLAWG